MNRPQRKLVILGLVLASCSTDRPAPSSPSAASSRDRDALALVAGSVVTGLAAGDVKSGPGTLDIERVRMDRQSGGRSAMRQYVQPGGVYAVTVGETVELWVEYSGATNPRLRVDWGAGEPDSPDITGCGSCLLTHPYRSAGRFTVNVTLDDRVSTTVTRTFRIDTSAFFDLGTCAVAGTQTGCSNAACQQRVCFEPTPFFPNGDAYCCGLENGITPPGAQRWDGLCASEAQLVCR